MAGRERERGEGGWPGESEGWPGESEGWPGEREREGGRRLAGRERERGRRLVKNTVASGNSRHCMWHCVYSHSAASLLISSMFTFSQNPFSLRL